MLIVIALSVVLGAAIGSFLNVVAHRVPAGRSVSAPASACPQCGARIRWYDNVPIVSWLVLRGRCRDCGNRISARYPLIEALTAIAFGLVAWHFGPAVWTAPTGFTLTIGLITLAVYLYAAALSVVLSVIDLEHHRLPNAIVLPAYAVLAVLLGTIAVLTGDGASAARSATGAGILFGGFLLIALIAPKGMGLGDVKLAGVIGLLLGWAGWGALAVGAAAAFVIGGLIGLGLIAARRARRDSGIPFGPCMLAGMWIGIVWGEPLARAYLRVAGLE